MKKRRVLIILYRLSRAEDPRIKNFIKMAKDSPPSIISWVTIQDVGDGVICLLRKKMKRKYFSEVRILYKNHEDFIQGSRPLKNIFFEKIECVSICQLDTQGNGWDSLEIGILPPFLKGENRA